MNAFIEWLGGTPLSATLSAHLWIIPAVQSVHIVAIAVLAASVVFVDLRLLRVPAGGGAVEAPVSDMVRRFAPWTYGALSVLLFTGLLLTIAEPNRELANPLFWTKMGLVVVVVLTTATFQRVVRRNAGSWDRGDRRSAAKLFVAVSLALWMTIIVCGRWIAYIDVQ